jgi:pimeloyl-ACP methyl ester carboxylesterase
VDALAQHRRVITVDYRGVGGSSGTPADSVEQMAREILAFTTALGLDSFDLLGVQHRQHGRPTRRPRTSNRGRQGRARLNRAGGRSRPAQLGSRRDQRNRGPQTTAEGYLSVFFTASEASRSAGQKTLQRIYSRTQDRDVETTWATRVAQYDAVAKWDVPNHAKLEEVTGLTMPAFVANGDSDRLIPTKYSYLIAGLLPNATIKIYPDAAHGFLFQHHEQFAADVLSFLDAAAPVSAVLRAS